MDLALDSTQTLLRDSVRGYLEAEVPFDRIRALEREGGSDEPLWKALCAQGWLGVALPEAWGGGGGTLIEAGLLIEELARRAAVVPVAEVLACLLALARAGSAQHADALCRDALAGSARVVPALLETGATPARARLALSPDRQLRGEKHFVDYGQCATHHLVSARPALASAADSAELFLVRCDASVGCQPLRTLGRTPQALVHYAGCAATRVGGAEVLCELALLSRIFAAVQCVGAAQQALDATLRYATLRVQFGRPIGSFQAVKHHAANMAMRVESSRFLVYEALFALAGGSATPRQIALAKASASRTVSEVTLLAHQIHGGNGVIEENDLYFFTLRGKDRALAWGSFEECLAEACAGLEGPRDWLRGPQRLAGTPESRTP
jgi:alkylation response protein AidB-like acyl-CoA dehydrogenase